MRAVGGSAGGATGLPRAGLRYHRVGEGSESAGRVLKLARQVMEQSFHTVAVDGKQRAAVLRRLLCLEGNFKVGLVTGRKLGVERS